MQAAFLFSIVNVLFAVSFFYFLFMIVLNYIFYTDL